MPAQRSTHDRHTSRGPARRAMAAVRSPYCPDCGERPLRPRELTLRGLVAQAFEAFTNIDGRVLRSFRALITRPGLLTVAFLQGRRVPYIGPVSLFLVTNVLFFATESLTGGTVFSTPLESHLHTQPWSPLAQALVGAPAGGAGHDRRAVRAAVRRRGGAARPVADPADGAVVRDPAADRLPPRPPSVRGPRRVRAAPLRVTCCCSSASRRRCRPSTCCTAACAPTSELLDHALSIALMAACGAICTSRSGGSMADAARRG